jgi:hypothetical protein
LRVARRLSAPRTAALDLVEHANLWTFLEAPVALTDGPQPGDTYAVVS